MQATMQQQKWNIIANQFNIHHLAPFHFRLTFRPIDHLIYGDSFTYITFNRYDFYGLAQSHC